MVLTRSNYNDLSRSFKRWKSRSKLYSNKSELSEMIGENLPVGVSRSKMSLKVNPPLKGMLKGSIEYRDYYNYEISWEAGTKHFVNVCNLGTKAQWLTQNFFTNMANESSQNWFSLAPNQGQVAGSFVPARTEPATQRMGVSNANIKYDMINLSSNPCTVKISWWKCVGTTDTSLLTDYHIQAINSQLFTSNFTPPVGYVGEPTTGGNETTLGYFLGSASAPNTLTTMPYINLTSRQKNLIDYRHLKSQTITMAAGDIHTLDCYLDLNIHQKKQAITDADQSSYLSGGVQCVIELQGLASHLVVPSIPIIQPAVNEITTGAGRLGIMISRHLNLKSLKSAEEKNDVTYIGKGHNTVYGTVEQSVSIKEPVASGAGVQTT